MIEKHIWRKGWAMLVKHRVADRSRPKELEPSVLHLITTHHWLFQISTISLQLGQTGFSQQTIYGNEKWTMSENTYITNDHGLCVLSPLCLVS